MAEQPTDQVPAKGRLLGIDYGTRRVGIAVCDAEQQYASPLRRLDRSSQQHEARIYKTLIEEYNIRGFVVGLPVHMSGADSQQSIGAREYGAWLKEATSLPVTFWDERFTSAHADYHLMQLDLTEKRRKALRDQLASQSMLQSFLDSPDRTQAPLDLRNPKE